jgi:hypothetical protein
MKRLKKKDIYNPIRDNTRLLRVGVVFLAVVSFFTTANGMRKYIFVDNGSVAYAASAAIQGILLALSMNLPDYLKNIWKNFKNIYKKENLIVVALSFSVKLILSAMAILLTMVSIFCSSLFSYVYIAEVIHKDSWEVDSELLVQQAYRLELYNAQDYTHAYQIYLEEAVGERILLLEQTAAGLSNSVSDLEVDWGKERDTYAPSDGSTGASYMAAVIDVMENAIKKEASQEERTLAITAVTDAKKNINNRMENIQQNLSTLDNNISTYYDQVNKLNTQISRAQAGVDVTYLQDSVNTYLSLITKIVQQQADLQTEYRTLELSAERLAFYESLLGLSSSTSSMSISSSLIQLQSEFFQTEPDETKLLKLATDIFDSLRNASRIANETEKGNEDALTYTNLLQQMNWLIRNLIDYLEVKEIEADIDDMIEDLRTVAYGAKTIQNDEWKNEWNQRLSALKAQISALPIFSGADVGNWTSSILTQAQINILQNYDRNESSKKLDDAIHRYVSNHNAIYNAILYLESPFRSLAIFALVLALAFDLSGFIFGIVVQNNEEENETDELDSDDDGISKDKKKESKERSSERPDDLRKSNENTSSIKDGKKKEEYELYDEKLIKQAEWSVLKTLKPYVILTGDYKYADESYIYTVFEDGVQCNWSVKDNAPYSLGIYIPEEKHGEWLKGTPVLEKEQNILFATQNGGPQDGVYLDCRLTFDEGSLLLVRDGNKIFLANIDDYVPAHIYNPEWGENQTVPANQIDAKDFKFKIVIVALNPNGTRVVAIYAIENS